MRAVYKKVKVAMPHCPNCKEQLSGNNSMMMPWECKCGVWKAVQDPFLGEYEVQGRLIEDDPKTHIQCEDCLCWVPKEWPVGQHVCPSWIKAAVLANKKKKARDGNNT